MQNWESLEGEGVMEFSRNLGVLEGPGDLGVLEGPRVLGVLEVLEEVLEGPSGQGDLRIPGGLEGTGGPGGLGSLECQGGLDVQGGPRGQKTSKRFRGSGRTRNPG